MIGAVVLGLAIVLGGVTALAGVYGVAQLGATGAGFYRGSDGLVAAGFAGTLIAALAGALTLGLGQVFRAVADMADNSYTLLFVVAALRGDPATALGGGAPGLEKDAPPGPTDL